jgi:hypothetical protein
MIKQRLFITYIVILLEMIVHFHLTAVLDSFYLAAI